MARITLLEMLLRARLITEKQCDDALQNRVFYGGKIGTSLIELGFVSEVDLANFLSRKLAVPYIPPENLKDIPPETIAVVPKVLAVKYQAIPLKLEKKKLTLAMADPSDLKAVDEIAFATGLIIRPVIAPEVRLIEALARYYEATVDPRYLQIAKRLEERAKETKEAPPETAAAPSPSAPEVKNPAPAAASPAPRAESPLLPVSESPLLPVSEKAASSGKKGKSPAAKTTAPAPLKVVGKAEEGPRPPLRAVPAPKVDVSSESGLVVVPLTREEEADLLEADLPEAALLEAEVVEDEWVGRIEKYSVNEVFRRLSRVDDREEIATILMDYLGGRFDRCALFTLRGGAAYGWKGADRGKEIPSLQQFRLPLDSPSVLKKIADGEMHLGPIPDTVSNGLLREALGGADANALALPLTAAGNTVAIVYADSAKGNLDEEVQDLKKILAKAGLAFEILLCREKILMA